MSWKKYAAVLYAVVAYIVSLLALGYFAFFVLDLAVPLTLNRGRVADSTPLAITVNLSLILLFGFQHSLMARSWFKHFVPAPIERSTYLVATSLFLFALFAFWIPIPHTVWSSTSFWGVMVLRSIAAVGVGLLIAASFAFDHWEFFGLKQAWAYFCGRELKDAEFKTPGPYRVVRHPMQLGTLLFIWAAPHMTVGHLLFSSAMTVYVFLGLAFEERDLVRVFGKRYEEYRARVPKLVPFVPGRMAPSRPRMPS